MADQELKLTVSLVDNATPQLGQIKSAMQGLGSSEAHGALRRTSEHTKNLGDHIGKLGHDVEHVAKHILPSFITGVGGIATGFLAVGLAAEKGMEQIRDFSKEMSVLDRVTKDTGQSAGTVKGMLETFQRSGIGLGQATINIKGLAAAVADLTRVGSETRQKLIKGAGLEHAEDMQRWLTGLSGKEMEEVANEVKEKSDEIYENMLQQQLRMGKSMDEAKARAADVKRAFLETFGAPDLVQVMEKFTVASPEEKATQDARIKAAKDFEKTSASIAVSWEKITASWKAASLAATLDSAHQLDAIFKAWAEKGAVGAVAEATEQTIDEAIDGYKRMQELTEKNKPVPWSDWSKSGAGLPGFLWGGTPAPAAPAEHAAPPPAEHAAPAKLPTVSWSDWAKSKIPKFQEGGLVSQDQVAMLHKGELVIPAAAIKHYQRDQTAMLHAGEGAETVEKQTKATDELTQQMKKLNDLLGEQVTTRMGGLRPGLGVGPGTVGGGGPGVGYAGGAAVGGGFGGGGFAAGGGYAAGVGSVPPMGNLPGLDTGTSTGSAGAGIRAGTGTGTGIAKAGSWAPSGGIEALKANAKGFVDKGALQGRLQELIKGSPLEGMKPEDAARFGIKTGSATEWASLMSEMAGKESSYKTTEVGDIGHFGSGSRGLFQLSQQDAITYGLQKTPFTKEQLADPDFNSRMAVAIMAKRVAAGGIAGPKGAASYWGGYGKPGSYLSRGDIRAADVSGQAPSAGDASQHLGDAFVGTGSANFMGSQRAREMGLVNPQIQEFNSGVPGIGKFKANQYAGPNIAGFLKDLHEAGAPLGAYAGAYVNKPGQHGMGNAVDIEHGLSDPQSKNGIYSGSPELSRWARDNPDKFREIQERYHMFNLSAPGRYHHSGASGTTFASDWGHFEYSPARRKTAEELTADRANMDRQMAQKVEGTGKIDVNVNAPKGTTVNAEGKGLFKTVNVARSTQMDKSSSSGEGATMDIN